MDAGAIPDSEFTLEALGVKDPSAAGWGRYWLLSLAGGAAVLLLVGLVYRFSRRQPVNRTVPSGSAR